MTKAARPLKATAGSSNSKQSPGKNKDTLKNRNPYSPSTKKIVDEKKNVHIIKPLVRTNSEPYGWAFENFYNAKDFVKDLSNRNDARIYFGGLEFKPFTNLTTRWVKTSSLGVNLWVLHIDNSRSESEGSFPMTAHVAYANKIARAVIEDNTFEGEKVDVIKIDLTESQEADLDSYFITALFEEARNAIFQESIQRADSDLEDLI